MPIYEFQCSDCGKVHEHLTTSIRKAERAVAKICTKCGGLCWKITSPANFRVTGANAMNGYSSIPAYDEVIDKDGRAKPKWSRK